MASDTLASDRFTLPPLLQPAADTDFAREYDVASRVPDFAAHLADWSARSGFARATHPGLLDLRYGEAEAETLDLFLPEPHPDPAEGHPLLVFIHGGFWRRLHKDDFSWIAPPYLERGMGVAVVNYGLAPATTLEEIVAQIRRSLAWLYRNAPRHHIDRCRIVVAGHSAGGHLACIALATDWTAFAPDLPPDLIAAGIALSPLADLAPLAAVPILHHDLDFSTERIATLSPIRLAPATTAPLVGAVGGDESAEFRRQLALLAHGWSAVWRGEVPMPGHNHLTLCEAFAEPGSALFAASIELLSDTK
ncbi:MAG: alpha/beta hydrolase [Azoarcus sp.]|nr:alpha/beta hydrolase [Azoarcus sp.]